MQVYLLTVIGVAALATFATRVLPFIFLARHADHPLLAHLGRYLPAGVMFLLVFIFMFGQPQSLEPQVLLPQSLAALVVIGLHLWRRQALISIGVGTGVYMLCVQSGYFT